jgi:hypothetical protein
MQRPRRVVDWRVALFVLMISVFAARADETQWRVWLEPSFMRTNVTSPIPGAKQTVMAAGHFEKGEWVPFGKWDFAAAAGEWDKFAPRARQNAAADLAKLKPRYVRDARHTIIYAALESEEPIVASAVLASAFLDLWKETLGEKVLVVVPSRFTAYVFPRLTKDYAEYAPMAWRAFRDTAWPVSVEVFEVSPDGWTCFGAYERP